MNPLVTTLEPLKPAAFYPAEACHWNYVACHLNYPYVVGVELPKVDKVREKFKDQTKTLEEAAKDSPAGK